MNTKKIRISIVVISVIVTIYLVIRYLQFPMSPDINIKYKDTTTSPTISYCSWRTNFYNVKELDNFYKMLESKDEIFTGKVQDTITIKVANQIGLKTEHYDSEDGIFIEIVKTDDNQRFNIPEDQAYGSLKATDNSRGFNLEITLPKEVGYYDYLIGTYYTVGVCEYAFKVKVED